MLSAWEHRFEKPAPVIFDDVGNDIGIVFDVQNQEPLIVSRGVGQVVQYPAIINGDDAVCKPDTRASLVALELSLLLDVPFDCFHICKCMDNVGQVKRFFDFFKSGSEFNLRVDIQHLAHHGLIGL